MLGTYQGRSAPGGFLAHGGSEYCDVEVSVDMFGEVVWVLFGRRQ